MTTTRAILNRAADLVEQGWCQYELENRRPDGITEYCVVGAIEKAVQDVGSYQDVADIYDFLDLHVKDDFDIITWNNAPNRTQSEVVALLRSVAAEC